MAELREHSENLVLGCLNGSLNELTRPDPIRLFGTHYRIAELSNSQNYQINAFLLVRKTYALRRYNPLC